MLTLKNLVETSINTLKIDWEKVEEKVGFSIHSDLKNFYSRVICGKQKEIWGYFFLKESEFIQKTGNKRFDTWFSFNKCEGKMPYNIFPLKVLEKASAEIEKAFTYWTGGNDFGHRALIGTIETNMGDFLILFNNDTGNIEWIDCGYGYFDVYEENPNGIIANSVEDFLVKLYNNRLEK